MPSKYWTLAHMWLCGSLCVCVELIFTVTNSEINTLNFRSMKQNWGQYSSCLKFQCNWAPFFSVIFPLLFTELHHWFLCVIIWLWQHKSPNFWDKLSLSCLMTCIVIKNSSLAAAGCVCSPVVRTPLWLQLSCFGSMKMITGAQEKQQHDNPQHVRGFAGGVLPINTAAPLLFPSSRTTMLQNINTFYEAIFLIFVQKHIFGGSSLRNELIVSLQLKHDCQHWKISQYSGQVE